MLVHVELTERIIGSARQVHTEPGSGLLESAPSACLEYEMGLAARHVECQVGLPVIYRKCHRDAGYRLDFVVEGAVIVELKALRKSCLCTGHNCCPT